MYIYVFEWKYINNRGYKHVWTCIYRDMHICMEVYKRGYIYMYIVYGPTYY